MSKCDKCGREVRMFYNAERMFVCYPCYKDIVEIGEK